MAQRYNDEYGAPRSRDDFRSGGRGGRSDYDEPPERGRERQRGGSRHSMYDDDVPDVRFGRNISEGEFSGGGERDFIDETSQGQHSGYGDYGQQDYRGQGQGGQGQGGQGQGGQGQGQAGPGQAGSGQRGWGRGESQRLGGRRERELRRGEFSRTDFDRDEFGRTRQYGSGSYGAGFGRGVSQDQDERDELRYRGGAQYGGSQGSGGSRFSGSQGSQFGSESRYSGLGRSYGGFGGGHQSYRGRGPRGYTRSDDRLKEVICEMLTDAEDIDASDIEVTVTEAVVVLDGSVDDRWTKYQTEEMAGQVPGVKDVRNQLRVGTGSTSGYGSSESTSGGSGRKGSSGSTTPKTG